MAGDAGEALHVEHLLHGDAAAAVAQHVVPTAGAAAWAGVDADGRTTRSHFETHGPEDGIGVQQAVLVLCLGLGFIVWNIHIIIKQGTRLNVTFPRTPLS